MCHFVWKMEFPRNRQIFCCFVYCVLCVRDDCFHFMIVFSIRSCVQTQINHPLIFAFVCQYKTYCGCYMLLYYLRLFRVQIVNNSKMNCIGNANFSKPLNPITHFLQASSRDKHGLGIFVTWFVCSPLYAYAKFCCDVSDRVENFTKFSIAQIKSELKFGLDGSDTFKPAYLREKPLKVHFRPFLEKKKWLECILFLHIRRYGKVIS